MTHDYVIKNFRLKRFSASKGAEAGIAVIFLGNYHKTIIFCWVSEIYAAEALWDKHAYASSLTHSCPM